jgi:hypothetical protein
VDPYQHWIRGFLNSVSVGTQQYNVCTKSIDGVCNDVKATICGQRTVSSGCGDRPERPQLHKADRVFRPAGSSDNFSLQVPSSNAKQLHAELYEDARKRMRSSNHLLY